MFDDIPDNYKAQTADTPEEGWRYVMGDKDARRPPELLTRDHVARCIMREVRDGRGSPHGGVFLDIAWIKEKIANAPEHIKRKLPSMYHQFKQLADIDITKEPMEVGPTTHYVMGGIRVDADTQMSTVPGLFAAGECAAGINGANRLGGNSLSDLLVFGKRAGEYAAEVRQENARRAPSINDQAIEVAMHRSSLEPFDRTAPAPKNPYRSSTICRTPCRTSSASSAGERDAAGPGRHRQAEGPRRQNAGVDGNREYNPGWHTALDLDNLLTISEAITLAAIERKESRGGHFRDDYPDKEDRIRRPVQHRHPQACRRQMQFRRDPIPEMPGDELKQIIEEKKKWRGDLPHLARRSAGGRFRTTPPRCHRRHGRPRCHAPDSG